MELTMQNNKTQTQMLLIYCNIYCKGFAFKSIVFIRVMTLFPALNLEALRVAADTLVPRFIPAIPKIIKLLRSTILVQVPNQLRLIIELNLNTFIHFIIKQNKFIFLQFYSQLQNIDSYMYRSKELMKTSFLNVSYDQSN
ncbi:Hypothetical_protein [Hexamita inflata]|uniref:Hypothetical_protein n=1 Tax=Hexamita inflata TaxID=28002 RepID=A0AA86NBR4_9EUKA|nr:Hypothetical protein HINF_LOCUS3938 [Hexamita inflata]